MLLSLKVVGLDVEVVVVDVKVIGLVVEVVVVDILLLSLIEIPEFESFVSLSDSCPTNMDV